MKYQRIQCLRCVAAVAVVLFHALGTGGKYFSGSTIFAFASRGDYGVDLFFVISGFIIMMTTAHRENHWRLFLKRRLERIVPLYWISTFVMVLLLSILYKGTVDQPSIGYLVSSLTYTTWAYGKLPIVYPGWTLEYEMAFYGLVTVAMAVRLPTWPMVILAISASVACGSIALRWGIMGPDLRFLTNPMYLEFALGILIGHVILGRRLPVVSTIGLVAAFAFIGLGPADEWRWRVLVAGVPAGLLVWAAASLDRRGLTLSSPGLFCARLGDASYSIYLVQVFVISIGCKVLAVAAPRLPLDVVILAVLLATLIVAYAVHLAIERPMARWFHARDRPPPRVLMQGKAT